MTGRDRAGDLVVADRLDLRAPSTVLALSRAFSSRFAWDVRGKVNLPMPDRVAAVSSVRTPEPRLTA
nr:hypothetical protein [Fodinicola feengrottensis]